MDWDWKKYFKKLRLMGRKYEKWIIFKGVWTLFEKSNNFLEAVVPTQLIKIYFKPSFSYLCCSILWTMLIYLFVFYECFKEKICKLAKGAILREKEMF